MLFPPPPAGMPDPRDRAQESRRRGGGTSATSALRDDYPSAANTSPAISAAACPRSASAAPARSGLFPQTLV